ncbi:hypothetical protein [Chryseobacterium sp.]|uniref:hypothetical protein n=1 Tax=Chryseobacterium sp. TaxID=1871047 RepID=UPI0025B97A8C|nr:hypothetical protein [Chryseobacterium sp.]MBV8324774.1 hypothetical protein [Chryseobacterium sp.]
MKKPYFILLISLILFIASLPFPAVYVKDDSMYGLACLLLGWAEMDGGGIAWLANPLIFFTALFFLMRKTKISLLLSLLSLFLMLCYLSVGEITTDEAGHKSPVTGYGPGYFLWVASCLTLFIGNLVSLRSQKKI